MGFHSTQYGILFVVSINVINFFSQHDHDSDIYTAKYKME